MNAVRKEGLLYPELSFQIAGILYHVRRILGDGYQEKHVQRAVALALEAAQIPFREQAMTELIFEGKGIGRYFFDFIIAEKIVVELKVCERPSQRDFDQVKQYLMRSGLQLGLLACFGRNGVKIYRVLNPGNVS